MTKKEYQALKMELLRCAEQDVITASVIEQGVQWDGKQWSNDLIGDFFE